MLSLIVAAETLRPVVSLDYDDILSLTLALGAILALFVTKRSKNTLLNKNETLDADVLGRFESVWEKMGKLEDRVVELRVEITNLENGIKVLSTQLIEQGHTPAWPGLFEDNGPLQG